VVGDCDTSRFQISDVHVSNIRGNITRDRIADLKCSPKVPCPGFTFDNINVVNSKTGKKVSTVGICENVLGAVGISCRSG
jgi:galacturan 1,4-alpha-galacturonidase